MREKKGGEKQGIKVAMLAGLRSLYVFSTLYRFLHSFYATVQKIALTSG
jgi:hypothetical protein